MCSTNHNNRYAVCIKTCELFNQIKQIITPSLSVGDLVQIMNFSNCSDRYMIQIYDRELQCFRPYLYECTKENLSEIPSDTWPFIQKIMERSIIKVRVALSDGSQIIVNFQVKFYGRIPLYGADQFYGLKLMPTPNLTNENVMELNKTYLDSSLNLIILRADKLLLNIVVNMANDTSKIVGSNSVRVEKTLYVTNPKTTAYDFLLLPSNSKPNVAEFTHKPNQTQEQIIIPDATRNKLEEIHKSNISASSLADATSSKMKTFGLPKIANKETSSLSKTRESLEKQLPNRINNQRREMFCFDCNQSDEYLVQFDCQHVFCINCLMQSLNVHNLVDSYCPYNTKNYDCRYKLTVADIRYILDIVNDKLNKQRESSKPTTIAHTCSDCHVPPCKASREICQCLNCKLHNGVKIQNCDGTQQATPNKTISQAPALYTIETWTCAYCKYGENHIDVIKCVKCSKTNENLIRKSNATEYYRLLELEENDTFMPNVHQFYCVFCDQTIASDDGVKLRSCLHNICRKCIVPYIESQNQVEIKCPHSLCTHLLQDREIKTLISPEAYANHLEKSLIIAKMEIENGFQCCTVGCSGFWIFDDANAKYNCPRCHIENCISCKASHPGIDCTVFKAKPI